MLYQSLLIGEKPYYISLGSVGRFREHRHPEAEFIYCLDGSFSITVEKASDTVRAGDIALVAPMTAHEFHNAADPQRHTLVIEVGPILLKSHFGALSKAAFTPFVHTLDNRSENRIRLRELLEETAELCRASDEYTELLIAGNVYKICAYILREFSAGGSASGDLRAVANIERALALIHDRFAEPLTVEQAASVTGYGKSNFCRIFKNITGDTFHNVLNRHRVENARCYLDETALPIAEIAPLVGFADAKTFCRVFKAVKGISPGQYRRKS